MNMHHFYHRVFQAAFLTCLLAPLCACGASSLKTGFNVTGGMEVNRFGHTATLLNDGRVLFTGGTDDSGQSTATAEVYDPVTSRFHLVWSMTSPREGHVATLLKSGRVVVVGGSLNSSTSCILNRAELYDPTTDTFTATRSMLTGRTGAAATLLADGRVLLTGGIGPTPTADAIDSTEIYDPAAQTFLSAAHMTTVRVNHVATLLTSGEVLVAGGRTSIFSETSSAEIYDPTANTFTAVGPMSDRRCFLPSPINLPSGEVLVIGGATIVFAEVANTDTSDIYDPNTHNFTPSVNMLSSRNSHSATLLQDGRILVTGGLTCCFQLRMASAELLNPSSAVDQPAGNMLEAR